MKRLSRRAKKRLLRQQARLERRWRRAWLTRQRARRTRQKEARHENGARRRSPAPAKVAPRIPAARIAAPRLFSVETNADRAPLLSFLAELRNFYKTARRETPLVIDFTQTQRFIANGTLLFFAELTRLIEYGGSRVRLRCTSAGNTRSTQVLKQIGILDMCNYEAEVTTTFADVVHWRVARGHMVDNFICAPAIEPYEGKMAEPLIDGIFRGLGEAMTNAKHHAYIATRQDGLNFPQPRQDWWMFSQSRGGFLSVVFCDLGVGIPSTLYLSRPELFATLQAFGLADSDAACIEKAIEDSRTRTRIPGRGWGLGNIVNSLSNVRGSTVVVMSNRGFFVLRNGEMTTFNFDRSILGTLIYWRVPLKG